MRSFLLYLLSVAAFEVVDAATVSGKILNYDGQAKVALVHSKHGMQPDRIYPNFKIANKDGRFSFEFEIKEPEISRLIIAGITYELILHSDSQLYLEISLEQPSEKNQQAGLDSRLTKKMSSLKTLEGNLSEVNFYLNSQKELLIRNTLTFSSSLSRKLALQDDIPSFDSTFSSLLDSKIVEIDDFLSTLDSDIEKDAGELLKDRFEVFYTGLFLDAVSLRRIVAMERAESPNILDQSIYDREWMNYSVTKLNQLTSRIQIGPGSQFYMELVSQIHYFLRDYDPFDSVETEDDLNKVVYYYLEEFSLRQNVSMFFEVSETMEKAFLIYNLHTFLSNQIFYSPVLLNATERLLKEYPYISEFGTIEKNIEKLKEYMVSQRSTGDIKIIRRKYDSFDDILDRCKGERLFVDIWATWCRPCIYQFSHMGWLYEKQKKGEVKIVFLSVDEKSQRKKWKEMIRFNNLQGTHFLLTDSAKDELWSMLDGVNGAIPRYLIINEQGQIVNSSASSPDNKAELDRELKKLL